MSSNSMAIRRRLSLLAGSSLVAASLSALAFTGAALTPASALAYDECTPVGATLSDGPGGTSDPTLNGATADSFTCTGATAFETSGVAYSSAGNLTVSVGANPGGQTTFGAVGIDLAGNGGDNVSFSFNGSRLTGTSGAIVDITSVSGAVSVTTSSGVAAETAGVTHAVRVQSTGGGNITFTKTGTGAGTVGINNDIASSNAAVALTTNGGNIVISVASNALTPGTGVQGGQRGILAQTSGAGSVSVTVTGNASGVTASTLHGVAGIEAAAGSGGLTMNVSRVDGGAGKGILATSAGAITVTAAGGTAGGVNGDTGAIDATAGGLLTVTVSGGLDGGAGLAIDATSGAGAIVNNTGRVGVAGTTVDPVTGGGVDFSGVTGGGVTFNNTGAGRWLTSGASVFSAAVDTLTMSGTGENQLSGAIDFGTGADIFNLSGRLTVRNLTLNNLETFNNSGVIYLGGFGNSFSNARVGDTLSAPGTNYVASGAARMVMDVDFAAGGQSDCSTALAADCVDFTGGTTAGATLLTIVGAGGSTTTGSSSWTTLVVGSSAAGDFVLDPASTGYVTTADGPAIRRRLFDFHLLYDASAKQHLLTAVPHVEAFQAATFAAAAQDVWRATTGAWFERQADLRATPGGVEPSRGLWVRGGVSVGERDTVVPLELLGANFDQAVSYDQRTTHIVIGADVLGAATQNSLWVVGASAGYVRSDVEYTLTTIETTYTGVTAGLYASWLSGPLFVDVAANANVVDLNGQAPSLGFDAVTKLVQTISSMGVQAQAGYRIAAGQAVFVEPLVSFSYVRSDFDDIDTPGDAGTLTYDDGATSGRVGAGVRVGMDSELMGVAASFSLAGRYWNEFEGENATILAGNAPTLLVDDFSGAFSEVTGAVNLFSSDGGVSGFVNLGGKFADDYRTIDGSVGVRLRW